MSDYSSHSRLQSSSGSCSHSRTIGTTRHGYWLKSCSRSRWNSATSSRIGQSTWSACMMELHTSSLISDSFDIMREKLGRLSSHLCASSVLEITLASITTRAAVLNCCELIINVSCVIVVGNVESSLRVASARELVAVGSCVHHVEKDYFEFLLCHN